MRTIMLDLPGYEVGELLYRGTRTQVHRARRLADERSVVLKTAATEQPSPVEISRLVSEYQLGHAIEHPGIVRFLELLELGHRPVLVLEDIGGTSLRELLSQREAEGRPLTLIEALEIAVQIAEALAALHRARVVHKDINPSNIVYSSESKRAKLIDLGIASLLESESHRATPTTQLEGTLPYISPEQTGRVGRAIDQRTDLYSLGITLYQLFSGDVPFRSADPMELVHAHIARKPELISHRASEVPAQLARVIDRLLAKSPGDRYQTAAGLAVDLERCREQLASEGTISAFELGERDMSPRLRIPDRLYGRNREIDRLLDALARAREGSRTLLLVSGATGVGKSALARQLVAPATQANARVVVGRFDAQTHERPYSAFVEAIAELLQQLLSRDDGHIACWREALSGAVGEDGQVLIDVLPEVELLLGPQPPAKALPPAEAERRFTRLMRAFFRMLASRDQPLVLLFDDLHLADAASLRLIELLMDDESIHHLLIVGSYRSGLEETHPLKLMRRAVDKGPAELLRLRLAPLSPGHITRLIVDTFHVDSERAEPLAELLHKKTLGNPFFLDQTLHALVAERLIRFESDPESATSAWRWELAQIERRDLADDVVELLLSKLARLPSTTRRMLELASCIGNTFNLGLLAVIAEERVQTVASALRPAIDAAILRPVSGGFSQLVLHGLADDCCPMRNTRGVDLCFLHPRFRNAAYERIETKEREQVHLSLGRLLRKVLPEAELDAQIFTVARHFVTAAEVLGDQAERLEVAKLHFRAGLKAQAAVAFDVARYHFQAAIDLLPEDRWEQHYELCFGVHVNYYQSLILVREVAPGTLELGEEILANVRGEVHRMKALAPHLLRLARAKQPERAIELGLTCLRDNGIDLLSVDDPGHCVAAIRERMHEALGDRGVAAIAELPHMTDPHALAKADLMHALLLPCYMRRRELVALVDGSASLLAIEQGNAPNSSMAYCGWAKIEAIQFGSFDLAYKLGQVAKRVADQFAVHRTGAYVVSAAFIDWMRESLPQVVESVGEAFRIGVETGETIYASLSAAQYSSLAFAAGRPLETLRQECIPYLAFIEANMGDVGLREIHITQRMIDALTERRAARIFDRDEEVEQAVESMRLGNREGIAWYHMLAGQLEALLGDPEAALREFEASRQWQDRHIAPFSMHDFVYHEGLAVAAALPQGAEERLAECREQLSGWVDAGAAASLGHKLTLLEAEAARLRDDANAAGPLYERAIQLAAEAGIVADQARANEAAGRFYRGRGLDKVAQVYLYEARYCYEKWGATAKVTALDTEFPQLSQPQRSGSPSTTYQATTGTPTSTTGSAAGTSVGTGGLLDLATVMKASQALAQEVDLAALLTKLLSMVAENAGAQRGYLVLRRGDDYAVEAGYEDGEAERFDPPSTLGAGERLSPGVVRYVARTGETVLLDDAAAKGRFRADPYVSAKKPRSLLCMPLSNQGQLLGALYFENNLATGAFTEERLEVLSLLAAQAGIAVVNARLFFELEQTNRTLEHKVQERTADLASKNELLNDALAEQQKMQQQLLISEKMASLGNLVAGVAHEINTPVGAMVSSSDTAVRAAERVRKLLEEQLGESLADNRKLVRMLDLLDANHDVIGTAGERVAEIVRTLRNFARLDEAERKLANIHEGIDSTLSLAKHRLKKGIAVVKEYGELPEIECYPNQLNQVFMNLVVNAIDAIEHVDDSRAGQITIRTHAENGVVKLVFSDNGNGIPEAKRAEIFNPGYTTKGVGVGTGLGLSIAFNIVDKHDGSINVDSEVGNGSTFTVTLPVHA
jgi:predicted ATPase/signal transduction histidine kinase/tRNA A-37 threonylcarbamoyl transferase component Bud32